MTSERYVVATTVIADSPTPVSSLAAASVGTVETAALASEHTEKVATAPAPHRVGEPAAGHRADEHAQERRRGHERHVWHRQVQVLAQRRRGVGEGVEVTELEQERDGQGVPHPAVEAAEGQPIESRGELCGADHVRPP
jgi:hypothetical protein